MVRPPVRYGVIRGEWPSAATRSASRRALSSSPKLPSWTAQSPEGAGAVRLAAATAVDAVAGRSLLEDDDVWAGAGVEALAGDSAFATVVSPPVSAALLRAGAWLAAAASPPEPGDRDAEDEDGLSAAPAGVVTGAAAVAGSVRRSAPAAGRASDDTFGLASSARRRCDRSMTSVRTSPTCPLGTGSRSGSASSGIG